MVHRIGTPHETLQLAARRWHDLEASEKQVQPIVLLSSSVPHDGEKSSISDHLMWMHGQVFVEETRRACVVWKQQAAGIGVF